MSEETTQNLPNSDLKLILARLDSIDMRLSQVETRFDKLESRFDKLETRFDALEEKVERRMMETRPLWESVLMELKEVNERLTRVENESKDFRRMFRMSFSDLARLQGDIEERLDKLEERNVPH
jgi:chromosome segregation ATPase